MTTTDGDRAMRRLIASSVLIAGASLASGCGLLEEGVEPEAKPALGSLETLEGKGFWVKLPCIPARSRNQVPVDGGRPLTMQTWICDGGDVRGHALDIVPADDRVEDLPGAPAEPGPHREVPDPVTPAQTADVVWPIGHSTNCGQAPTDGPMREPFGTAHAAGRRMTRRSVRRTVATSTARTHSGSCITSSHANRRTVQPFATSRS